MKKFKFQPDEVMFTADTHFGHANIIRFCDRPFEGAHHMNEALINNWNQVVDEDQTVFHLGDFAFKCGQTQTAVISQRLNGNIILIRGNHDKESTLNLFEEVHDLAEVVIGKQQSIILCHYAMRTWPQSFRGAWQLHGHSHGTLPELPDRKTLDIGVDSWGYKPVSFAQIEIEMRQHEADTVDDLNRGFINTYGKDADLLKPE